MQEFNMPFSDKIASIGISFDVTNKKEKWGFLTKVPLRRLENIPRSSLIGNRNLGIWRISCIRRWYKETFYKVLTQIQLSARFKKFENLKSP